KINKFLFINTAGFAGVAKIAFFVSCPVDKRQKEVYHTNRSVAKCFEQDMTYPYHRSQKAVGRARRQQGTGSLSPASSFDQRQCRVVEAGYPPLTGKALRKNAVPGGNERSAAYCRQAKW
ncbi:hypothetical protein, partial [Agathobaculum butyriciproducens]|uniref:hypothetical protein n=1 Tax=Agathobaculum butyriciproducens TaxID=1628085 RepID=UPI003A944A3F